MMNANICQDCDGCRSEVYNSKFTSPNRDFIDNGLKLMLRFISQ